MTHWSAFVSRCFVWRHNTRFVTRETRVRPHIPTLQKRIYAWNLNYKNITFRYRCSVSFNYIGLAGEVKKKNMSIMLKRGERFFVFRVRIVITWEDVLTVFVSLSDACVSPRPFFSALTPFKLNFTLAYATSTHFIAAKEIEKKLICNWNHTVHNQCKFTRHL